MNVQCSVDSRSFAKETRALSDEEQSGQQLAGDDAQLRGSSKLILLQLQEKSPKNTMSSSAWLLGHLKQIGEMKKLDK